MSYRKLPILALVVVVLVTGTGPVASATVARPSLDDVYLRHTGRSFTRAQESAEQVLETAS